MTRPTTPVQSSRTKKWTGFGLLAVLLVPGAAWAGTLRPELGASVGSTFAVVGEPSDGGSSASLSMLWPVAPRVAFGVMLHGDDAGSTVDSLRDEQGHGIAGGKVEQVHRAAWGASWRLDVSAPPVFRTVPFASASWGWYRIADDLRGHKLGSLGSAGFSLGAGMRRPLGGHVALGAVVRYHRLFNDHEGRFMSAGLDITWR